MVERYRTRFLFVEIPSRVYQSLRRAVHRRCNLYGAVRDTSAPDWPWPWWRAANHGRGDSGAQCSRDGRGRAGRLRLRRRVRAERRVWAGTGSQAEAGARGGVAATAGKWWGAGGRAKPLSFTSSLSLSFCCRSRRHRHRRAPVVFGRSTIFRWSDANDIPPNRRHTRAHASTHTHARTYRFVSYHTHRRSAVYSLHVRRRDDRTTSVVVGIIRSPISYNIPTRPRTIIPYT